MDDRDELRVTDYAHAVRRWWVVIAVVALVCGLLAALYNRSSGGDSTARVDIDVVPEVDLIGLPDLDRPTGTFLAEQLDDRLDRYTTDIDSSIDVSGSGDQVRIVASASTTDEAREDALTVAQRYVDERRAERRDQHAQAAGFHIDRIPPLTDRIEELDARVADIAEAGGDTLAVQTQLVQALASLITHQERAAEFEFLSASSNADVGDPIVVEENSGGIGTVVMFVVGAIVGLLVGTAVVLVRAHIDRRVRTGRQITRLVPDADIVEVVQSGAGLADVQPLAFALTRTADTADVRTIQLVGVDPAGSQAAGTLAGLLQQAMTTANPNGQAPDIVVGTNPAAGSDNGAVSVATLLVARSGKSNRHDVARVAADLRLAGVPLAGVILGDVPRHELAWAFEQPNAQSPLR